ncbi:MAG: response regulator [bacterium]|jgi:FixJ family two-component response regulator
MVVVIENDDSMRRALLRLLAADGIIANGYGSAEGFLRGEILNGVTCLILDMHLDGMDSLALNIYLRGLGLTIPTIYLTASEDEKLEERAIQEGAVALFRKPFQGYELIDAAQRALSARAGS